MPFEIFKPPKIHEAIANTVGKSSGVAVAKGLKVVTGATNKMRAKGCPPPAELAKVANQVGQVGALSGTLNSQLSAFKSIPSGLKAPVGGIRAAVASILSIAIPQAFPHVQVGPPGLPVSVTLKFYDLCNKLKEMAAAFELTADAVGNTVSSAEGSIQEISRQVKALEAPIKACKINQAIKSNLTNEQAGKLGLLDSNGDLITETLGSKILEKANTRPASEQLKLDLSNSLGVEVNMKGTSTVDEVLNKLKNPIAAGVLKGDAYRLLPPGIFKLDTGESVDITGNQFAVFTDKQVLTSNEDINLNANGINLNANGINLNANGINLNANSGNLNANSGNLNANDINLNANDINLDANGNTALTVKLESPNSLKPGGITGTSQALAELNSALTNISDKLVFAGDALANDVGVSVEVLETLKKDLEDISSGIVTKKDEELTNSDLTYRGYLLKIIRDPASPKLAPRHFAVAIRDGKQEIKGPSSFSSSKEVLLDEIKFRIDNQLS